MYAYRSNKSRVHVKFLKCKTIYFFWVLQTTGTFCWKFSRKTGTLQKSNLIGHQLRITYTLTSKFKLYVTYNRFIMATFFFKLTRTSSICASTMDSMSVFPRAKLTKRSRLQGQALETSCRVTNAQCKVKQSLTCKKDKNLHWIFVEPSSHGTFLVSSHRLGDKGASNPH